MPECFHKLAYMLKGVKPGMVLISLINTFRIRISDKEIDPGKTAAIDVPDRL